MKKAYIATNCADDEYAIIVFSENATEAKKLAYGDDIMDRYIDIRVNRASVFDRFYKDGYDQLDIGESVESDRVFREEGWYRWEGDPMCDRCYLREFDSLPDSFVGEDGLCVECRRELDERTTNNNEQ